MPTAPEVGRLYLGIDNGTLIKLGWTSRQIHERENELPGVDIICSWPGTSCRARSFKWAPLGCCDEHTLQRRLRRWSVGHERIRVPTDYPDYTFLRGLIRDHGGVPAETKFNVMVLHVFGAWRPAA
jgi:hypothetical protein